MSCLTLGYLTLSEKASLAARSHPFWLTASGVPDRMSPDYVESGDRVFPPSYEFISIPN